MSESVNQFRYILLDLRAEMFQRFTLLALLFYAIAAYLTLLIHPLPLDLLAIATISAGFVWWVWRIWQKNRNLARYLFAAALHVSLMVTMGRLHTEWLPFLGLPLLFMTAFLVSRGGIITLMTIPPAAIIYNLTLNTTFPLAAIFALYSTSFLVMLVSLSKFHTALTWYSSMHDRANVLLEETRDRRAELLQTLRSLETAYQTQRRMQDQLRYARKKASEAQRMKEQFAANISHELRTPLNLILGFSEIMYLTPEVYGDISLPPKLYRDISQIYRSSRYLLDMVDDVLDLSHIELSGFSLDFRKTDLNHFLDETTDMLRNLFNGTAVQFIVDISPGLPTLDIDRTRLRQVLLNLINNARHFTDVGAVTLGVRQTHHAVEFTVTDTGIGIPGDKLPFIFDEFFQVDYSLSRSHGGAGLGLAITRRFVEAHNGRIYAESEEGLGATFTFILPLRETDPFLSREQETDTIPDNIVLVIDPDPAIATIVQRHLDTYQVIQISDENAITAALDQYHPRAVIRNRPPGTPSMLANPLPLPDIEIALPSSTWLMRRLNVSACLAKPLTAEQITKEVKRFEQLKTILIVDDDMGFVQLVQRSLEMVDAAFTVYRAYDGGQALELMQTILPDLVLLDLAMPEVDGFQVLEAMHASPRTQNIPVILLTATRYIQDELEQRAEMIIRQPDGLRPKEVLNSLKAILDHLEPRYDVLYV